MSFDVEVIFFGVSKQGKFGSVPVIHKLICRLLFWVNSSPAILYVKFSYAWTSYHLSLSGHRKC